MGIPVNCTGCKLRLTVGEHWAGKVFKCVKCGTGLPVPDAAPLDLPPEEPLDLPSDEPTRANLIPWIAGGVGVLLLAVAVTVFALRKPAEVAERPDPSPATATPAVAPVTPAGVPPKPETTTPAPVAIVPERIAPAPRELTTPREVVSARPTEPPGVPMPPGTGEAARGVIPELPPIKAEFLGSEGTGRRFCIIADNSGSMNGENIEHLRTQLLKSIEDLNKPGGNFFIYCFNTVAMPMPHTGWLKAGSPEVDNIRKWVEGIQAMGGTNPQPAFEDAFKMNPRPDVIFFMTDGLIPPNVPQAVLALNKDKKVVINTILFEPRLRMPAPGVGFPPKGGGVPPKGVVVNPKGGLVVPPKGGVVPKGGAAGLPPIVPNPAGPQPLPPNIQQMIDRAEVPLKEIATQNGGTFTKFVPKN